MITPRLTLQIAARAAIALAIGTAVAIAAHHSRAAERRPPASTAAIVTAAAKRHGVPVRMAHAIVQVESNYNCRARNHGALGLGQVLPRTARGVGVTGRLTDCATGAEASMRYLRRAIDRHGLTCAGVSAYQRGIEAPARCTAYGRRVLNLARGA